MVKRKMIRLAIFLVSLIVIFSQCFKFKKENDPRGNAYAGSKSCVKCHKDIYRSYLHTAHFIASQPADSNTIQGSFVSGANEFLFNASMKIVMDKHDNGFYQTSYINGKATESQ